jgi:hypothetical protein
VDIGSLVYYIKKTATDYLFMLLMGDDVNHQHQHTIKNIYDWKGIKEKGGQVNSTKAYITNDETSCGILNRCYTRS